MTSASLSPISIVSKRESKTYTFEKYLRKEAKSVDKHEFINGKIIKMPGVKIPHNIIAANISGEMRAAFKKTEKKYLVFSSDQLIYFPKLDEGVYPDALVVCEKPVSWKNDQLLLTNPLLVVEVLSKSTSKYDRTSKFDKYKTLESFKEYVLIRQDACYAEVWYREKPGLWHETIVTDMESVLPLQSVGIHVEMREIYSGVEV